MDARIIKAMRAMGLSEERISEFGELVDRAKERVRDENMVYRKAKPAAVTPVKPKGRTIRLSYSGGKPKRSGDHVATRTLSDLAKAQARRAVTRAPAKPGIVGGTRLVTEEIQRLEARLDSDSLPDWQRRELQTRVRVLKIQGETADTIAAKTTAHLDAARKAQRPQRSPVPAIQSHGK